MNRMAVYALTAIALLLIGFGSGWHAKGVSVLAGTAKDAKADVTAITTSVQAQVTKQTAKLEAEQGKSVTLAVDQQLTRDHGATIQLEIRDAVFTPAVPAAPGAAAVCADPHASPEFVRLYNGAAAGHPAAAASTGAR